MTLLAPLNQGEDAIVTLAVVALQLEDEEELGKAPNQEISPRLHWQQSQSSSALLMRPEAAARAIT
jgi:hypothetical protein